MMDSMDISSDCLEGDCSDEGLLNDSYCDTDDNTHDANLPYDITGLKEFRSGEDNVSKITSNRWYNTEFNLLRWADCHEETVTEIPANIDGWCKFKICCAEKDMMNLTKDGRP
jgi:hypothetical protein